MSTAAAWFHRYDAPADPGLRLVCFPHAGGSPSYYRSWQRRLPTGVELLAVCYPGRQERIGEPAIIAMSELADRLTRALLPQLDRPFAFFGHSMGSAVAYECALRLAREHGLRPTRFFASGRGAPHRVEPSAVPLADADARTLVGAVGRLGSSSVRLLSEEALRDLLLPPLRADFRLIESYRPGGTERIGCPVVVYSGDQDHGCTPELVRAWAELTTARAQFRTFAGGHFYLEQAEDALLRHLGSHLADDLRLRRVAHPAPR